MIAEAAHFRAEHRGFNGGDGAAFRDWVQAEGEVDERKASGLKADARTEWHHDVERLTKLRAS